MPGKRMRTESGPRPTRTAALKRRQTRRGRNALVRVPRNKIGFPQSMRTKLRYCSRIEFVPTGTAIVAKRFLANGLFDPDTSLGGHQPRGFDEFMKAYETFTVKGSSCSCSFMYEGYDGPSLISATGNLIKTMGEASNQPALTPMICGLHKGTDVLAAGTGQEQIEKDRTTWTFINGVSGHKTLATKLKVSDFYGKPALTGAEGYTGNDSSDPTEQVFYELWCGRVSDDYPAEQTKVVGYVTIEYDVVFTEPRTLNAS